MKIKELTEKAVFVLRFKKSRYLEQALYNEDLISFYNGKIKNLFIVKSIIRTLRDWEQIIKADKYSFIRL